jgi:PAS domain S-box-containing protein
MPDDQMDIVNAVLLGKASNIIKTDANDRQILYSFVPISRSGWGVIVSHPTDKAFASSQTFFRGIILILLIFMFVGIIFWIGLNHQALRPLSYLVEYSQTIGKQQQCTDNIRHNLSRLSDRDDQVGYLTNSLIRMEKAIDARLNELSSLLKTSAYVLSSLESQIVLQRILDQVENLLEVDMSAIFARDERIGFYKVQACHGFSSSSIESIMINPDDPSSPISRAFQHDSLVQISDTEIDLEMDLQLKKMGCERCKSILVIPLNTQHAPPSSLLIFKSEPHTFSEQEITLLSNFANQAAMAIENATLFAHSDTRLQAQTRRLEALIQSMNDGLILGNLEGKILYANRSACEWTNLSLEDIVGSLINDFIQALLSSAVEPETSRQAIEEAMDSIGQKPVEIPLRANSEKRYLRLSNFHVTDSGNNPIGYGLILQDITADYELDRLKSSLISTVSHELRTPLASIKGYTTTLLAEDVQWDVGSQREFLNIILEETNRLSAMVSDLLDLSRIEAGDNIVSRTTCDFKNLVMKAALRAQPKPGNRLQLEIPQNLPQIYLDVRRIEVVMRNLIENATKYAGPHSPIRVTANLENGNLIVRVEDEGPGFPKEETDRIFDRFYRIHQDDTTGHTGFGLGLSICQGFIKAHGGKIWTETCRTGARVGFSLPIEYIKK